MICIWSSWCHCHPIIPCFIRIQIGLTFLVVTYPACPVKEAVKWVSALCFVIIRGWCKDVLKLHEQLPSVIYFLRCSGQVLPASSLKNSVAVELIHEAFKYVITVRWCSVLASNWIQFNTLFNIRFWEVVDLLERWVVSAHQNCPLEMEDEWNCSGTLFQMTGAAMLKLRLPSSVTVLSMARSPHSAERRLALPVAVAAGILF